jgi:hypothetical protein
MVHFPRAHLYTALSSLLHGYFNYTCHRLTLIGEHSHLFDLAHILFYLRWLWRILLRGVWHTWRATHGTLHEFTWSSYYI